MTADAYDAIVIGSGQGGTPLSIALAKDADTKKILGCAVLGIEGGELMAMFETAMLGNLPYTVLKDGIFAHPTLAESLNNLFKALAE